MNWLGVIFNAFYQACEGDPAMQRIIVAIAQEHNDRMATINRTEPVRALR